MIDAELNQQDLLIAFENLYGDHTGAAQAAIIRDVLNDYKMSRQFHCFVGDNASSNDGKLSDGLNLHPNIYITADDRMRCAGHIINLIVKATMYGDGVSRWEEELAAAAPWDQFKKFRQLGVVGKLHNFVNAVCSSHKRRELFHSMQKQANNEDGIYTTHTLQLRQAGGVRWHSTYLMLLRCHELKKTIQLYVKALRQNTNIKKEDGSHYDPQTDALIEEEWDEVEELVDFLQPAYEMTKRLEGDNCVSGFGSLWQTLPNLQALWTHYNDANNRTNKSKFFATAVAFGKAKLDHYFDTLLLKPDVSLYAVATALNPKLRVAWFKTQWKRFPHWYKKAEASLRKVYKRYADEDEAEEDLAELLPPPTRRKVPSGGAGLYERSMEVDLNLLTKAKSKRQKRTNQLDDYLDSLAFEHATTSKPEQRLLEHEPRSWWLQHGCTRYPIVFRMACDYLSIPSTSCECERAFSKARRTITADRNRLSGATIVSIQLIRNWLQRGVVKSSLRDLKELVRNSDQFEPVPVNPSQADDGGDPGSQSNDLYCQ